MTKQLKLSALVAALLVSASAFAAKPGYTADQSTNAVTRNNYNECWRTAYFDKATEGLVECGDKAASVPVAVTPAAPTVSHETVTLSAKVLFAFDKAVLRPEAKDVLDPLVAKLKGANLKGVTVNGYTDFLGSEKYNLTLSQKRADAVKDYFVAGGVPSDKVVAVGQGPANATMTAECSAKYKFVAKKGRRASPALKACLEADRRVELGIDTVQTVTK